MDTAPIRWKRFLIIFFCSILKAISTEVACPSWEENPWCPCYTLENSVRLECALIPITSLLDLFHVVDGYIQELRIYDLDTGSESPKVLYKDAFANSKINDLHISHSNIWSIADEAFNGLENTLEKLSIIHCNLYEIPARAIRRLHKLNHLNLESNKISKIQEYTFAGLYLKFLNLNGNEISSISKEAFLGLEESVESIKLTNNHIVHFSLRWVSPLRKLRVLLLSYNNITNLQTAKSVSTLQQMEIFEFTNNKIENVGAVVLSIMPKLSSFSASMNTIKNVSENVFSKNGDLESIYMNKNLIKNLSNLTFQKTIFVKIIDLSYNFIEFTDNCLFCNLPNLEELYLSNNKIEYVTSNTFKTSRKLRTIDLSHNYLRYIDSNSFHDMPFLNTVILNNNNLMELHPHFFSANSHLEYLDISFNQIKDLNKNLLSNQSDLWSLSINNNYIDHLPQTFFYALRKLKDLNLHHNNISLIPKGAFINQKTIHSISLKGNPISQLTKGSLPHSPNALRILNLSLTKINTLDPEVFIDQQKLTVLHLENCYLATITDKLFVRLGYLEQLFLNNNQINSIDESAFSHMKNLKILSVANNNVAVLNPTLFKATSQMTHLNISHNRIEYIEATTFHPLSALLSLDISHNSLKKIEEYFFEGLNGLKNLYLNNNKLISITDNSFRLIGNDIEYIYLQNNRITLLDRYSINNPNIKHLNLENNLIFELNTECFFSLNKLKTLNLNYNKFDILRQEVLRPLTSLEELYLKGNGIRMLENWDLLVLQALKKLDLSKNDLNNGNCPSLGYFYTLQDVNLNENKFESICQEFNRFINLHSLQISKNKVFEILSSSSYLFKNVKKIDLSHNKIRIIPRNTFHSSNSVDINLSFNFFTQVPVAILLDQPNNIEKLNLNHNPLNRLASSIVSGHAINNPFDTIKYLDVSFSNLGQLSTKLGQIFPLLEKIMLRSCQITEIYEDTFEHSHIKYLDLSQNSINLLKTRSLNGLRQLESLNISNNILKDIHPMSPDLEMLMILDISFNQVTEIHSIQNLKSLKKLYLRNNKIKMIESKEIDLLVNLEELDVKNNMIHTLKPQLFTASSYTLQSLMLGGNPWQCDCSLRPLWIWMEKHLNLIHDYQELTCTKEVNQTEGDTRLSFFGGSHFGASLCSHENAIINVMAIDRQTGEVDLTWEVEDGAMYYGFKIFPLELMGKNESNAFFDTRNILEHLNFMGPVSEGARSLQLPLNEGSKYKLCIQGLLRSFDWTSLMYDLSSLHCINHETPSSYLMPSRKMILALILGCVLGLLAIIAIAVVIWWYCNKYRDKDDFYDPPPEPTPVKLYGAPSFNPRNPYDDDDDFAC